MRRSNSSASTRIAFIGIAFIGITAIASAAAAEDRAPAPEIKPMCQATIATVMVGKVSCTAALCNTGASQGGFTGMVLQLANRGAIEATSFSAGVSALLATALKQTGCFAVVDASGLEQVRKELEALGKPAPPPPSVDYLVSAAVTAAEYVYDESGFLGYKKVTVTSSLTLDTKLVEPQSGTVSGAGSYDAKSERTSSGLSIPLYHSNSDAAKRGNPFADVTREVVVKAASALTTKILALPPMQKAAIASPAAPPSTESAASAAQ